jgi:hypothetical protein
MLVLSQPAAAGIAHVQSVGGTGTSSGTAVTFPAFPAIGSGHTVVGLLLFHNTTNTVTSIVSGANTYNTFDYLLFGGTGYSAIAFALHGIVGNPTTITVNFSAAPAGTDHYLGFSEYSGASAVAQHAANNDVSAGTTLAMSVTTTVPGSTVWTAVNNSAATTPAGGWTRRLTDATDNMSTADILQSVAGAITATWTFPSTSVAGEIIALSP